jgi:hypothetical protein
MRWWRISSAESAPHVIVDLRVNGLKRSEEDIRSGLDDMWAQRQSQATTGVYLNETIFASFFDP